MRQPLSRGGLYIRIIYTYISDKSSRPCQISCRFRDILLTGDLQIRGSNKTIIRPHILEGVTRDMDLDHKESFGPVMILIEFETDESAVQLVNDSEFSLCASIFSCNVMRAMDLAKEVRASSCHMNGPTVYIEPTLPNGGVGGSSGYGRFGGIAGVEEFTERKIISLAQPGMKYNF